MKKTFPLHHTAKADPSVLEGIKHDLHKYLKRERRKTPPEGFDFWAFDCRIGADPASAVATPLKELVPTLDRLAQTGGMEEVYIEILATPAKRPERVETTAEDRPEEPEDRGVRSED